MLLSPLNDVACTVCRVCKDGGDRARNHCPERTVLGILGKHGTYAEYITLPCRNLHVVSGRRLNSMFLLGGAKAHVGYGAEMYTTTISMGHGS